MEELLSRRGVLKRLLAIGAVAIGVPAVVARAAKPPWAHRKVQSVSIDASGFPTLQALVVYG